VVLPPVDGVAAGSLLRVRMCARIGESAFWTFVHSAVNACFEDESNDTRDLLALSLVSPEKAAALFRSLHADRNELCAKRKDISALTEQLRYCNEGFVASQADCGKYLDTMRAMKQDLALAQDALNQREARNGQLDRELQNSEAQRARLQENYDRVQEDRVRTAADLARIEARNGQLDRELQNSEAQRTRLQENYDRVQEDCVRTAEDLARSNASNGELDRELRNSEAQRTRLQENYDRVQEDRVRTAGDLARSKARNGDLDRELQNSKARHVRTAEDLARAAEERAHARFEVEALRTSWSWKLTAPLRYVGSVFLGK
jgi:chromosome segregation ATPase